MEYIRQEYAPLRITASQVAVISTGRTLFHSISINKTQLGNITIRDGTTATDGTTLAIFASTNSVIGVRNFDWVCPTGLVVITNQAEDITIASSNN